MTGEDLLARAFLHETDHLNGTLYINHISPLKRDLIRRKIRKLAKGRRVELRRDPVRRRVSWARRVAVPTLERGRGGTRSGRGRTRSRIGPKGRGQQFAMSAREGSGVAAWASGPSAGANSAARRGGTCSRALDAEVMVVVGYGQIIPQAIIDLPPHRNHQRTRVAAAEISRRGADPVGDRERRNVTGVTTMQIDAGLDTGDMLLQSRDGDRAGRDSRGIIGRGWRRWAPICWFRHWQALRIERFVPEPRTTLKQRGLPILKREDGLIDWDSTAFEIHNRIARDSARGRALIPHSASRGCISGARNRMI